ncbi:hypothetical protein MKX01_010948 [Papaver californicum]|nr:hypothetical protein MKX01_010948 [Papaver californicum]
MHLDLFSNFGGMFGHDMAKETRNTKHPDISYGDSAPKLQRVDVCILSAAYSSTGYGRIGVYLSKYTQKKEIDYRNKGLMHLFAKSKEQRDSYDPIYLSDLESDDEWITEKKNFLAQGKGNNDKKTRLVDENEDDEIEEVEEEEIGDFERSKTQIQAESDNEWLFDDGYDLKD